MWLLMALVRTFVAIDISEEARRSLAKMIAELQGMADGLRWVKPESVHLTLKFLGEVAEERLPQLETALRESARGIAPFTYTLTRTGCFPNCRRPRVLWVGVDNPGKEIFRLQRQIEEQFVKLDFPAEKRPFTAHLTVARVKRPFGMERMLQIFREYQLHAEPVEVTEVRLMRSQLKPSGAEYSAIYTVKLG